MSDNSKKTQFKPGESGNTHRGKSAFSFKRTIEERLREKYGKDYLGRTKGEVIVDMLINHALKTKSIRAAEILMERLEGKPTQAVDMNANIRQLTTEEHAKRILELLPQLPEDTEPSPDGDGNPKVN